MSIARLLNVAVLVALALHESRAQTIMPNKLRDDLNMGSPAQALATLKRIPTLVHSMTVDNETPLHLAAARGHTEIVRRLVAHGADVNATCYNQFTPLHLAANGNIAAILLKAGAKLHVYDSASCMTPLQRAARARRMDVVQAIRDAGEPLDVVSALLLQKTDVARELILANPAAVRGKDEDYVQALELSARSGDRETARVLLKAGMDVNAGWALAVAVEVGQTEMVEFLCANEADPERDDFPGGSGPPRRVKPEILKILQHYKDLRKAKK